MDDLFASRVRSLKASGIRKIFNLSCSMKDSIDLSIGQGDFNVPAPIKQVALTAIENDFNRYTVTPCIFNLSDSFMHTRQDFYCPLKPLN